MRPQTYLYILAVVLSMTGSLRGATAVTHREFQAVDAKGDSIFIENGIQEVQLEGILLNSPEHWVDPTPDPTVAPFQMGGEWEIFMQGEGDDHAGTACWMGQNYGNLPWGQESYSNEDWLAEITWLNRDPGTGRILRPGDRVRVTGRFLFYAGKLNINEQHNTNPANDFRIELLEPAVGLPQAEPVTLSDLKDASDEPIFDPDRLTGPEYYQTRLVRLKDVNIVDPENWGPDSDITVTDATDRTFPVHLCRGAGLEMYPCPEGRIDVIGILDQNSTDGTRGYRLLVLDHDGDSLVLGTPITRRGSLPGDLNNDYRVDETDLAILEANMGKAVPGLVEREEDSNQ